MADIEAGGLQVQDAARVGAGDDGSSGPADGVDLPLTEVGGHLRVGGGVRPAGAAAQPVVVQLDEIRGRLEAIAEELADLAIIRLRESIDAGGTELPVDEKRLTRARRAVEKAVNILKEPDDSE